MVPLGPEATNLDHNFEAINDTGVSSMTLCFTVLALEHFATTEQLESFGKGDNTHVFLLHVNCLAKLVEPWLVTFRNRKCSIVAPKRIMGPLHGSPNPLS